MVKRDILINSINKVKEFSRAAGEQEFTIDLVSGRYVIDAKSIMGIFSIDLSTPVEMHVHANEKEAEEFLTKIDSMIVK